MFIRNPLCKALSKIRERFLIFFDFLNMFPYFLCGSMWHAPEYWCIKSINLNKFNWNGPKYITRGIAIAGTGLFLWLNQPKRFHFWNHYASAASGAESNLRLSHQGACDSDEYKFDNWGDRSRYLGHWRYCLSDAGFGLLFGYSRRLAWSGIGFTFFITAFCIEVYPLVNSFWTKTAIQSNNSPTLGFGYDNRDYNIFLSDRETSPNSARTFYGNSLTNAIKCALSVAVAFSAVLGRVGHLECLIVAVFGTVGFELNRQIIQQNQGIDTFGTFYIFTFGGFMGLALGLL